MNYSRALIACVRPYLHLFWSVKSGGAGVPPPPTSPGSAPGCANPIPSEAELDILQLRGAIKYSTQIGDAN